MPRGGPRPNSGRKKGSRNKRDIGLAERMVEAVVEAGAASTASTVPLTPQGKKLARDVLEDFMLRFADMASKEANPGKFERYARFAVHCAQSLAPYQSPTFKAVTLIPPTLPGDVAVRVINLKIFDHTGTAVALRNETGTYDEED
jgi:hypothetical protein